MPVAAGLDPGEAETLVVSGLTAYQMLHRRAKVRAGQTVLIHGVNCGVGTTLEWRAPCEHSVDNGLEDRGPLPVHP